MKIDNTPPYGIQVNKKETYTEYVSSKRDYFSAILFGVGLVLSLSLWIYAFLNEDKFKLGSVMFYAYTGICLPFLYHTLRHLLSKICIRIYSDHIKILDGFLIFKKRGAFSFSDLKKAIPAKMAKSGQGPIGPPLIMELSTQIGRNVSDGSKLSAIKLIGNNINNSFGKKMPFDHSLYYSLILNQKIKDYQF